ncbi:MAG: glutamate-5-semialdehyde dehydrogenase [Bacillota bacterium]|jgi:glutamate-5-semialdehyde dehydrogenase
MNKPIQEKDVLLEQAILAKKASRKLAVMSTETKNRILLNMADALEQETDFIIEANSLDMESERKKGTDAGILDRLLLTPERISEMANGLRSLAGLADPIGKIESMSKAAQGIQVGKMRVPLGVVAVIYEARPNVTTDVAGICLKTGNAVILRGSSSAINSNKAIASILSVTAISSGAPNGAIQLIEDTSRETSNRLMRLNDYIDVLIPRGGGGLIKTVVENASVPVIETGTGNCHIYVDKYADLEMAANITLNAKCQRPAVCNAAETLLVHQDVAMEFLPTFGQMLAEKGVEVRGCPVTCHYIPQAKEASEDDYYKEFLSLILAVKVVNSLDEAMDHIARYSSGHSEAIITNDYGRSWKFLNGVDSAAVYVNASTRFTDGFQYGFGAEIGISTQKIHARGPMGLEQMTTYKYIIIGQGQARN